MEQQLPPEILRDIDLVSRIPIINSILEVICRTTGMGFSAVASVSEEKWVACSVRDEISFGLKPGSELQLETTICNEIRKSGKGVIIDHVDKDKHFSKHHTPAMYGFQSYISIPINRKDGTFFGTLCAIDPKPAKVNSTEIIGMFTLFADLIAFHLQSLEETSLSEEKLKAEKDTADLREKFIAILGHDLRNPVGAILMGTELLSTQPLVEDDMRIVKSIRRSANRIARLISNIMDFAYSRLSDGINLKKEEHPDFNEALQAIIDEQLMIKSGSVINFTFEGTEPVYCDSERIGQLFSNLLSNAVAYGKEGAPVNVHATSTTNGFELTVTNNGQDIPEESIKHLFEPFYRGKENSNKKGLGLGLYIASEIAKAHGGNLSVKSADETISFILTIPSKN